MNVDLKDYVEFNANREFGQTQYASAYIDGDISRPNLGHGLRFINNDGRSYHGWFIHKDDAERFRIRINFYKALMAYGTSSQIVEFTQVIEEHGDIRAADPSHYDYLSHFYAHICEILDVRDHYNGSFSSNGDKMSQYRDVWEKAGIPWFHGAVCYMLMDSVYTKEVRTTPNGWVDPAKWVIDNYRGGHNLSRGMIENNI